MAKMPDNTGVTDVLADRGHFYLEAQEEEIEVLRSIYGDEWKTDDAEERSYNIEIAEPGYSVTLYVTLPEKYPFEEPPVYTLLAPALTKEQKNTLSNLLNDVYLQNVGENVLYQWIEKIRDFLISLAKPPDQGVIEESNDEEVLEHQVKDKVVHDEEISIIHGETISDRKSTFQGHLAIVHTTAQVRHALAKLRENKKIANATHNIYAYRILKPDTSSYNQDCEDDGETQAGGRLLHLLQILNVTDCLVVVSRWYGGIQLGPDRFRHINNAARQVLEQAGIITNNKKKKA